MRKVINWFKSLVEPVTLTEQTKLEMERQALAAEQAQHTIRQHQFLLHMACVNIEGLSDWHRGVNIRSGAAPGPRPGMSPAFEAPYGAYMPNKHGDHP